MMALALLLALASHRDVAALGDTLCAEAQALPVREIAIIGRVAVVRARDGRRSVAAEIAVPDNWAHGCPRALLPKFKRLAKASIERRLRVPRWANRARAFCTKQAMRLVERRWRARGFVPIRGTKTVHVFWEKKRR